MAKLIVFLSSIATVILFYQPYPVQAMVNWPALQAKVNEMREIVKETVTKMKAIANHDNPDVEKTISPVVDQSVGKCEFIFGRVSAIIEDGKLSVEEAETFFKDITTILLKMYKDIEPKVSKLSKADAEKLEEVFYIGLKIFDIRSYEASILLRA